MSDGVTTRRACQTDPTCATSPAITSMDSPVTRRCNSTNSDLNDDNASKLCDHLTEFIGLYNAASVFSQTLRVSYRPLARVGRTGDVPRSCIAG